MNNLIQIKGKILYIYETPKNKHLLLRIGCGANVLSCFITDDKIKEQFSEYKVGDYINLSGNIQSSRRYSEKEQKIVNTQITFVDNINPRQYVDKGFYNRFWLNGTVSEIRELNNCLKITVRTDNDGRISFVPVTFYYPDVSLLNFEIGERIQTQRCVQSVRKIDRNGNHKYFQNYVGSQEHTG